MALSNAERQKQYRARIKAKMQGVIDNITSRNTELETALLRNELALLKLQASINETNDLLKILIDKLSRGEIRQSVIESDVMNQADKQPEPPAVEPQTALRFDLEKSKAIAAELRGQGLTANQISRELANRGYGNQKGKAFIKSSINKWFQKKK